jgi:broad specificity phosphatase PhoE
MEGRSLLDEPLVPDARVVRIVLVRHGESTWNVESRFEGHSGAGLSDAGRKQARCAAEALARMRPAIRLAVASDLRRVQETVKPFVELTGLPVTADIRLREIDSGTWSGRTFEEMARISPDTFLALRQGEDVRRGGGETFEELRRRVTAVIAEIARSPLNGGEDGGAVTAVVFTHGGPIRVAAAEALGLPTGAHRRLTPPANCSMTELEVLVAADGSCEMKLVSYNVPISEGVDRNGS